MFIDSSPKFSFLFSINMMMMTMMVVVVVVWVVRMMMMGMIMVMMKTSLATVCWVLFKENILLSGSCLRKSL